MRTRYLLPRSWPDDLAGLSTPDACIAIYNIAHAGRMSSRGGLQILTIYISICCGSWPLVIILPGLVQGGGGATFPECPELSHLAGPAWGWIGLEGSARAGSMVAGPGMRRGLRRVKKSVGPQSVGGSQAGAPIQGNVKEAIVGLRFVRLRPTPAPQAGWLTQLFALSFRPASVDLGIPAPGQR
jgi:hypothetical protein